MMLPPKVSRSAQARSRRLTVIAQDPRVRSGKRILRAQLDVPAEALDSGPAGYRVSVIDYDATTDTLYQPRATYKDGKDPFDGVSDDVLLGDPTFHAQNVYAIAMCTLTRFEYALGRRVAWGFRSHQLKIAPHAFADANAFYSKRDESLLFGYFPKRSGKGQVFSCLSHDVVAHETTHAILDGLRTRYTDASSPDQAAFHEGFADVVALLSVFAQKSVVNALLPVDPEKGPLIAKSYLTPTMLRGSQLVGLAEQMGQEMQSVRGDALRRSADLTPNPAYYTHADYKEPHRRGEVFVAAMMNTLITIWHTRMLGFGTGDAVDRERVVEEGAELADRLLTIAIRAIDYAPPVDLSFGDYLSALVTADGELFKDDTKYEIRKVLPACFAGYGILPAANPSKGGTWDPAPKGLHYDRNHFELLQRDKDEIYRFIWENRKKLMIYPRAYTEVLSVRPAIRQGGDGFFLRETVAEYIEVLRLRASELGAVDVKKPTEMPDDQEVFLYGGGALIFDEFGRLKFHVKNRVESPRQQERINYLSDYGFFDRSGAGARRFAQIHLHRATPMTTRLPGGR